MPNVPSPPSFPDTASLSALRAWYAGVGSREAVERYCPHALDGGRSARGVIGRIRRQLAGFALSRHRTDLVPLFQCTASERARHRRAVTRALDILPTLAFPQPQVSDLIDAWLSPRVVSVLHRHGIRTLTDLTVRIPRRRRWWRAIPGLGMRSARHVEAFFAAHPQLTERARALVVTAMREPVVPWENIRVPHDVDGSRGTFRAPKTMCALDADNDWQAISAWLERREAVETQRAYRREAERLLLWAIVERGRALSSLTSEDATAYRAFLRHPAPRTRWVAPARPRSSPEWRPFTGALSPDSIAYALSVLGAMFRWLIEQRYVLANPFAGLKVRGAQRNGELDVARAFTAGEWELVRTIADGLEWSYGWTVPAAQRLRFVLDFGYGTGLRAAELVGVTLGGIEHGARGERWLHLTGKGAKVGKVVLPQLAGKLRRATPHWMRHTHATHALAGGATLTSVRDNLRHASISTTSVYLDDDEVQRMRQIEGIFARRTSV